MTHPETVPAALRAAAATHGDRPAVVDGDTTLTFRDLHDAVRDAARGYRALGLEGGDRVCVWAPNTWEWVVAGLAVTYAGGVLVPVNTRYKGAEVADLVARSGARLVVLADGFLGRSQHAELRGRGGRGRAGAGRGTALPGLPGVAAVVRIGESTSGSESQPGAATPFDDLAGLGAGVGDLDTVATSVEPDDLADILFTSGTTGRSKGVLTSHRQTLAAARVWSETCRVTESDRYLVISPFFHAYGYKVGILAGLLTGCALYPVAAFDADEALAMIERERLTIVPGAPTIFHSLLESPAFPTTDTSSLRLANMGAASIPPRLIERMLTELSFELVIPAFGMTECVVATMCRPGDPEATIATTNGRAVDGLELRVVDPATGDERAAGEEGELLLRGSMVMQGYLDDPEATAEAIDADGWLHTGDIGTVDEAGNMRITDRLKDMYVSRRLQRLPGRGRGRARPPRRRRRGRRGRHARPPDGRGRQGVRRPPRRPLAGPRRAGRVPAAAAGELQAAPPGRARRRPPPQRRRQGAQGRAAGPPVTTATLRTPRRTPRHTAPLSPTKDDRWT